MTTDDWSDLFAHKSGALGGLDTLRVWWLLQELKVAGLEVNRADGDRISVIRVHKDAGRLDDRLRSAIRECRSALLLYIDGRDAARARRIETPT